MKKNDINMITKNDIVAASSPLTESLTRLHCCKHAGFGSAILKSTADYVAKPSSHKRKIVWESDCYYADGSLESEIQPLKSGVELYIQARKHIHDMLLIPSVCAFSLTPEDWIKTCNSFVEHGADIIQLDMFYLGTLVNEKNFLHDFEILMKSLVNNLPCAIMPKLNINFPPEETCSILSRNGITWVSLLDSIRKDAPAEHHLTVGSTSCFGHYQLEYTLNYLDIAVNHGLMVCAGGGVNSIEDVNILRNHNASLIQIASYALKNGYGAVPLLLGKKQINISHSPWCDFEDNGICSGCCACKNKILE